MKYVVVTVMKTKQMQGSWNTIIIVFQHKWCFHLPCFRALWYQ